MDTQLDDDTGFFSKELRDFFRGNIKKEMKELISKMESLQQTCS